MKESTKLLLLCIGAGGFSVYLFTTIFNQTLENLSSLVEKTAKNLPANKILTTARTKFGRRNELQHFERPGLDKIFFLYLNKRESWPKLVICSVKTAAVVNVDKLVVVFTLHEIPRPDEWDHPTKMKASILIRRINASEVLSSLPDTRWYLEVLGRVEKPEEFIYELSDILRYALLYIYGGIYLDTDTLSLSPFGNITNTVVLQTSTSVCNGMLFFEKKSPVIKRVMELTKPSYSKVWGSMGPLLMTKVSAAFLNGSVYPITTPNLTLITHEKILPVGYSERMFLIRRRHVKAVTMLTKDAYTVHLWRKVMFSGYKIEVGSYLHNVLTPICGDVTHLFR